MVKVEEINDEASLAAWLNARPEDTRRQEAILLASRNAILLLPIWVQEAFEFKGKPDVKAILIFRRCLIASIAGNLPDDAQIRSAALSAATSAFYTQPSLGSLISAIALAASSDFDFAGTEMPNSTFVAIRSAKKLTDAVSEAIRYDCRSLVFPT